MCGLAGVLLYPGERAPDVWRAIRDCFTQTLIFNEERGRYAAGVAVIQGDGTVHLLKEPMPASAFVETAAYREIMARVGPQTTCILGHARMPTKGSRWNNANNHPIVAGHVVGIHNGHIRNDDELFARFRFPRTAEVDSEIIFRLLDAIPSSDLDHHYLAAVRRQISLLDGLFATLSVDLRRPTRLLVLKYNMPLCVHYHEPWQVLCFSSRYLFLRKAFGRAVITEALSPQQGYLFEARQIPDLGKQPFDAIPLDGDLR